MSPAAIRMACGRQSLVTTPHVLLGCGASAVSISKSPRAIDPIEALEHSLTIRRFGIPDVTNPRLAFQYRTGGGRYFVMEK